MLEWTDGAATATPAGTAANPTYKKVCGSSEFKDWAEAVQVDYDSKVTSYEELVSLFFKSHSFEMGSGKRQYMSASENPAHT
jgi:peptide methionine sulfoxide reductase MsrA